MSDAAIIGLISDTHGLIRRDALAALRTGMILVNQVKRFCVIPNGLFVVIYR
jgi:hypothetical protein